MWRGGRARRAAPGGGDGADTANPGPGGAGRRAGRRGGGRRSGTFRRGLRVQAAGAVKGTAVTFGERRRWARPEGDALRGASHRERPHGGPGVLPLNCERPQRSAEAPQRSAANRGAPSRAARHAACAQRGSRRRLRVRLRRSALRASGASGCGNGTGARKANRSVTACCAPLGTLMRSVLKKV